MNFKGLTLHNRQKDIADDIIKSSAKYFIVNASRQSGKSVLMSQLLLYFGINNSDKDIVYITPTYSLGKKLFKNILKAIRPSGVVKRHNLSNLIIELINGSEITFLSAESYDNIRGLSLDYIFLDEFAFFKEDAWASIKPTVAARKHAKVVISSTPKGKNLFHELAKLGESENVRYEYYYMHYSDNPNYDIAEVLDAKKVLPDAIYRQEYEAEFIDDGGTVFKGVRDIQTITEWSEPEQRVKYFAGIDVGKKDSTVLTIMDYSGKIVFIYSINNQSYEKIISGLLEVLNKYNPLTYIEVNSVGDVLFDMLSKEYRGLVAWHNTNKVKTDMIELLVKNISIKDISLPTAELFPTLDFELSVFTFEYNPKTRTIRYAASGSFHDDTVISLGLANLINLLINSDIKNKKYLNI